MMLGIAVFGMPCGCANHTALLPSNLYSIHPVEYIGGNGTSERDAIRIRGARSTLSGVQAERMEVARRYPSARVIRQDLFLKGGTQYDVLTVATGTVGSLTVYFDISDFYGSNRAGVWRFIDRQGAVLEGDVTDDQLPVDEARPWCSSVGLKKGQLQYQVTDGVNEHLVALGELKSGQYEGLWKFWRPNEGLLESEFRNGRRDGVETRWDASGRQRYRYSWKDGKLDGPFKWWDKSGRVTATGRYVRGALVEGEGSITPIPVRQGSHMPTIDK